MTGSLYWVMTQTLPLRGTLIQAGEHCNCRTTGVLKVISVKNTLPPTRAAPYPQVWAGTENHFLVYRHLKTKKYSSISMAFIATARYGSMAIIWVSAQMGTFHSAMN